MLDKLWTKWKDMRANDPVKARLVRVLLIVGVVVLPFLSVWAYAGFAKALGMVVALGVCGGIGLVVLALICNVGLGWVAHYILFGEFDLVDEWFNSSILDEWDYYQLAKLKKELHPKHVNVTAKPETVTQTVIGNNNVQVAGSTKFDSGPDWLKKP